MSNPALSPEGIAEAQLNVERLQAAGIDASRTDGYLTFPDDLMEKFGRAVDNGFALSSDPIGDLIALHQQENGS